LVERGDLYGAVAVFTGFAIANEQHGHYMLYAMLNAFGLGTFDIELFEEQMLTGNFAIPREGLKEFKEWLHLDDPAGRHRGVRDMYRARRS